MVYQIRYKMTTKAPILLTRTLANTFFLSTDNYVCGSTIRGIFARQYIALNKINERAHLNERFNNWFLRGALTFCNVYPFFLDENIKDGRKQQFPLFPRPFAIIRFRGEDNVVYDRFWKEDKELTKPIDTNDFCCLRDKTFYFKPVKKTLNFHHARHSATDTPIDGGFFNYEAVEAGQLFHGTIMGSEKDLNDFIKTIGPLTNPFVAYIGRSRNAQYGKVEIRLMDDLPKIFKTEIDGLPQKETEIPEGLSTVTFLSDTIIYDQNGFPTTSLSVLAGNDYFNTKIEKAYIKVGEVENFISVWKLRRSSERCLKAGSSFLIEIDEKNKAQLLKLQYEGIGERRNEGFGRIALDWGTTLRRINQSFEDGELANNHDPENMGDVYSYFELKPSIPSKPIGDSADLPDLTRLVLHKIIMNHFYRTIEVEALQKASDYENNLKIDNRIPPKSLLGRLEIMVKKQRISSTKDTFLIEIKKLRLSAKYKLNACRNENDTLLNQLKTLCHDDILKILEKKNEKTIQLAKEKEIAFNLEDSTMLNELYCDYLLTLLTAMRWMQKQQKGKEL